MADNFEEALAHTLVQEGGWYPGDEERDTNPTMRGVTQKVYNCYRDELGRPHRSVQHISADELRAIYREYWEDSGAYRLRRLTAMAVFDMAVNAGASRAAVLLQRTLAMQEDGIVGPKTLAAAYECDEKELACEYQWQRLRYYNTLAKQKKHKLNLWLWLDRVLKLQSLIEEG